MKTTIPLRPLAFLLLGLAACRTAAPTALGPLEEAAREARSGGGTPREQALAGFAAYLLSAKPDEARAGWQRAGASGGDVWAQYGRVEAARRWLDTRAQVDASLRLCETGPRHPLCSVGARIAAGAVGESPALDTAIESRALGILGQGASGDAAFLLRLAASRARRNRGDAPGAQALLAEAGVIDRAALLGPYSRLHHLEWDTAFAPERAELGGAGPLGPVTPRDYTAPDGRLVVWAEPTTADVYYWATDFEVAQPVEYVIRANGQGSFKVFLDGAPALERRAFESFLAEDQVTRVLLPKGRHRLLTKISRGSGRGDVWLAVSRADGAPANLSFAPAQGTAPVAELTFSRPDNAFPTAASLANALESEVGSVLASFVAARDALGRDVEGARRLAEALAEAHPTAPMLALRAEALLADESLPEQLRRGRAHRDLEDALKLDPGEVSALQRLSIHARGESRFAEAARLLEAMRTKAAPEGWRVALTEMMLAQSRGLDAQADEAARRAAALEPGLCDALGFRYDLARRIDAARTADELIAELSACPAGSRRLAEHRRLRGDLAGAREAFERVALEAPLEPGPRLSLAEVATAQGRHTEAATMLADLTAVWPRDPTLRKLRADALERAGNAQGARAERETALLLNGADLKLRRALAFEDGREPLDELRQDGAAFIQRYREAALPESSAGVYVLDASAVEVHPDDSFTERTHVIAKVVDQRGVSILGEVELPEGAEILQLRTIKQDGRVLEPETIAGKEGISLPGVEVGDLIEYEYLSSTAARGVAVPGFTAPRFYFEMEDGQLFHSIYELRAPKGTGLTLDAHGMQAPEPVVEGDWERVRVERSQAPTYVREPGGPTANEVIPFVQAGAGAGTEELMTSFADFLLDRTRPTPELHAWTQRAASGAQGLAAVKALYAQVMIDIKGPEGALTSRAAVTLAQGRGSRTILLKSALESLGIQARVVLVRPFNQDPAPYRFPAAERYGYAALLVSLPEGEVFLAPAVRFAPFGRLPPFVSGQEAALLPRAGEAARLLTTPATSEPDGKAVTLDLALQPDGTLTGTGEEVYLGYDGAFLKSGLEQLNEERRRQAVESSIARTFENAALIDFSIEEPDEVGAPVTIRYRFAAPGFARVDGGRLVVSKGLHPSNLAPRFLALSERKTPLLLGNPENLQLTARVALPPGMALVGEARSVTLESPFGSYERVEEKKPGQLALRERLSIGMNRIAPDQYRDFGAFVTGVDRIQAREWVIGPEAKSP